MGTRKGDITHLRDELEETADVVSMLHHIKQVRNVVDDRQVTG